MPICDSEQVAVRRLVSVGVQNEAVLVDLVWVVGNVTNSCCKGIFGHDISFNVQGLAIIR